MGQGLKSRAHWDDIGSQHRIDIAAMREHGEDAEYDRTSSPPSKPTQQVVKMTGGSAENPGADQNRA